MQEQFDLHLLLPSFDRFLEMKYLMREIFDNYDALDEGSGRVLPDERSSSCSVCL